MIKMCENSKVQTEQEFYLSVTIWYIMEKIFARSCSTKYRFILLQHSNLRPCEIDFLYTGRARITYKHSTLDFLVNKWDLQVFLCRRIFSLLANIFTYFLLVFSFILLSLHSVKSIFMIVECFEFSYALSFI